MVEEVQASTDTEPRRESGRQARQARPRTPVGQQDDKFDFGKFIKGDLPGKLGTMLVRFSCRCLFDHPALALHCGQFVSPRQPLGASELQAVRFWPPLKSRPGPSMHAACPATA